MKTELTDEDKAKIADATWRQDTEDFHNAIAGRETGRQTRFGGKPRNAAKTEREKTERAFRDALDQLLQDPAYRALYKELGKRLSDAERRADTVLVDIQIALRKIEDDIADMEARAAKTLDGKLVFRTADGRVVDVEGDELPPEIAEGIQWPSNAPSAEEYFGAMQQQDELAASLEEWQGYRNDTLGGVRDRYEDRDNPQSIEGLKNALDLIEQDVPALPIETLSNATAANVVENVPTADFAVPKLPMD